MIRIWKRIKRFISHFFKKSNKLDLNEFRKLAELQVFFEENWRGFDGI